MSVTLKLPRQQRRTWFSRPRPERVTQAVQGIPLLNAPKAAQELNRMLRDLNFTACGARRRERCLAPFHEPVRHLNRVLVDSLAKEAVPLSEPMALQAERVAELWSRLAVGHLCALRDARRSNATLLSTACLSALQALGRLILVRYHCYAAAPAGAWQAIHQCHQAAAGLAGGTAAPVPERDTGDATDFDTAYKQILVLGGTDPHRLRQSEQAALYQVLAHWARLVNVRRLLGSDPKGASLVFRPEDDEPPALYAFDQLPETPGFRMLDTAPLAARAHHRLRLLEAGDHGPRLSGATLQADTLRAMISVWSGAPQRRFPRARSGLKLQLILGLSAACAALDGAREPASLSCQLLNKSATGFSLVLQAPAPGSVQVGELALTRQAPSSSWTLGVVRWMRHEQGQDWVVGVELMSRDAQGVSLRKVGAGSEPVPALFLPANRAAHTPPTLVTPRYLAVHNGEFVLCHQGTETPLALGRRVELTGSFCQYRFLEKSA